MAGIVLECSQHGHFDSFDVIRSLTSMVGIADSDLPSPIASGLLTMYYVDLAVVEGVTYYYKFRVWRDGVALVSDEIGITAQLYDPNILINMPFSEDMLDHSKYAIPISTHGTPPTIVNGALRILNGSGLILNMTNHPMANVGTKDFEFGIEFAMFSSGNGAFPCVFGIGTGWESGAVSMQLNGTTQQFMAAFMNPDEKDAFSPSNMPFDGATFVKYKVRRVSGVVTTYKAIGNSEFVAGTAISDNLSINLAKNGKISIGIALWSTGVTASNSLIKNLYFKLI